MNLKIINKMQNISFNIIGTCRLGEPTELRIKIARNLAVREVYVIINKDGEAEVPYKLEYECLSEGIDIFSREVNIESAGLYYYYLRIDEEIVGLDLQEYKAVLGSRNKFQLTVYEEVYALPEFLQGGLIYQIFPDRFFAHEPQHRESVRMHENWYGTPDYAPNEKGKVINNDFFGGNLQGIIRKLDYLKNLSVTAIYLNPIFTAHSNHKYDTADYMNVDPSFGTNKDFEELCRRAAKLGISVILDGVFSHTGSDSIYFNKAGRYPSVGAYNSPESPYYDWYTFYKYPDKYNTWWGFETLPAVDENSPSFREFICGENGVARTWIRRGAAGFRLDVADELPDSFIEELTRAVKAERADAVIYGEVWEDASDKISYCVRRKYFLGRELDSVMNYPFREAVIKFLTGGKAAGLAYTVSAIVNRYPPAALNILMNLLSSHDTVRILTALSGADVPKNKHAQAAFKLSGTQRANAKKLLKLAAVMQYILPGTPCLYYGDEAGMEGFADPFCRAAFIWGREDTELQDFYRQLGKIRTEHETFKSGCFKALQSGNERVFIYERVDTREDILVIVNAGTAEYSAALFREYSDVFTGEKVSGIVVVSEISFKVLKTKANF